MEPTSRQQRVKIRVLTCIAWLTLFLCGSVIALAGPAHFSQVTVRVLTSRSDTIIDEVWTDTDGRFYVQRRSDHWDNGLVVVSDGKRVQLRIPFFEQVLEVPFSALRNVVDSTLLSIVQPVRTQMVQVGEENVMGHPAVLLRGRTGEYLVNRWVDKETRYTLREERLDRAGHPFLVLVRNELPVTPDDPSRFQLVAKSTTKQATEWHSKAINAWVAAHLRKPLKLNSTLPAALRLEGADLLRNDDVSVVVLRLARGDELISVFLAPATGTPPTSRRLLDKGTPVQVKRIGSYDVTLVGELPLREVDLVFGILGKQLTTGK